jgi:predicted dehydrogenase
VTAVAATGIASHVSQQAKAAQRGANETIRVGFIGTGGQGYFNMGVFMDNKDVTIPVVCDVNRHNLTRANKSALDGKAEMVEDYRRVLDRKDIDAVVICTPDHWHAIPTIAACKAGKDVYVEKPMTYCIAEGRRMADAARKYDRVVQVGIQQQSGPHYIEAAELVQSGKLGKVTHVRTWNTHNRLPGIGFPADGDPPETLNWDFWLGPAPRIPYNATKASGLFRMFWDYAGGTITDWGTHHMGTVHHIMGEDQPKSAAATGGKFFIKDLYDTPDTMNVLWEYPGGWTLEYTLRETNGRNCDGSGYGLMFYGTNGTMYVDRSGYEVLPEGDRIEAKTVGTPRKDNFMPRILSVPHIRNFLDCIKSRKRPIADVEIGHRATIVPHLGNISLRSGEKVVWDAEKETIINSTKAAKLLTREYRKPYILPEI